MKKILVSIEILLMFAGAFVFIKYNILSKLSEFRLDEATVITQSTSMTLPSKDDLCDEYGDRYTSTAEAIDAGLSESEFGATYCPEYKMHKSWDINSDGVNDCYDNDTCFSDIDYQLPKSEQGRLDGRYFDKKRGIFIIESEAENEDECLSFEKFDAENLLCVVECKTEEECDTVEDKIDSELDTFDEDYEDFAKDFKEFDGDEEDTEQMIASAEVIYKIKKDEKFIVTSGTEKEAHRKIKKWLADISPNIFSDTHINRLIILPKITDDEGTLAFVAPSSDDLIKWDMFINMKSLSEDDDKEKIFTIIHEFAHILTLNSSQVDAEIDESRCKNYAIQEGCLHNDAYLNLFYKKFWMKNGYDIDAMDSDVNYDKTPSAFVDVYAATNPGEDIAESFASFIFKKKNENKTVAEQKVSFFYSYPELITMRTSIRNALSKIVRKRIAIH